MRWSRQARQAVALALCLGVTSAGSFRMAQTRAGGVPSPLTAVAVGAGGPTRIVGTGAYTFFGVKLIYDQPDVLLIDRSGLYVDRNVDVVVPTQGQILGTFSSPFGTPPFRYSVPLPAAPGGALRDVGHDDRRGVEIFSLDVAENFIHDAYLQPVEQGAGSLLDSLTTDAVLPEITGGTLLVYAPDAGERFPSGFGPDGRLFTADDPLVTLPQGYTVVRLQRGGFVFDRSRVARMNALEDSSIAQIDFSRLSYTKSFDALITLLARRYAYTAYRHIDWSAVRRAYYPRIARAQAARDAAAYYRALFQLVLSIHDAHTNVAAPPDVTQRALASLIDPLAGSLGLSIAQLDDGHVIVSSVDTSGPAARAGLTPGTQLIAVDGRPIAAVVAHAPLLTNAPTPAAQLQIRLLLALHFPLGRRVALTYRARGARQRTATLTAVALGFGSGGSASAPPTDPLSTTMMHGYGYAIWPAFERPHATLARWEAFIRRMIVRKAPGIILDMRQNPGGSGQMGGIMASYLFGARKPYVDDSIGSEYDPAYGRFVAYPQSRRGISAPSPALAYRGKVVVLIGPQCASECEFFSYGLRRSGRAAVVGSYPSIGAGGSVNNLRLPAGITFYYTQDRVVDAHDVPIIEGRGVAPTVRVPVTAATVLDEARGGDPILRAAIVYLRSH